MIFMPKSGRDCFMLPLKASEEGGKEKQEVTASLASAKEISADAAVEAMLSKLDSKKNKKKALRFFFLSQHHVFPLQS